jgi:hypothetical protein
MKSRALQPKSILFVFDGNKRGSLKESTNESREKLRLTKKKQYHDLLECLNTGFPPDMKKITGNPQAKDITTEEQIIVNIAVEFVFESDYFTNVY